MRSDRQKDTHLGIGFRLFASNASPHHTQCVRMHDNKLQYSKYEYESNDNLILFVELSNVHKSDRSSNALIEPLVDVVDEYLSIQALVL